MLPNESNTGELILRLSVREANLGMFTKGISCRFARLDQQPDGTYRLYMEVDRVENLPPEPRNLRRLDA